MLVDFTVNSEHSPFRAFLTRSVGVNVRYSLIQVRTHKHTHACLHTDTQAHTRARARARAHTHTHTHTSTHTHTHTHTHARTQARTHIHTHTHARARAHTHTHQYRTEMIYCGVLCSTSDVCQPPLHPLFADSITFLSAERQKRRCVWRGEGRGRAVGSCGEGGGASGTGEGMLNARNDCMGKMLLRPFYTSN